MFIKQICTEGICGLYFKGVLKGPLAEKSLRTPALPYYRKAQETKTRNVRISKLGNQGILEQ